MCTNFNPFCNPAFHTVHCAVYTKLCALFCVQYAVSSGGDRNKLCAKCTSLGFKMHTNAFTLHDQQCTMLNSQRETVQDIVLHKTFLLLLCTTIHWIASKCAAILSVPFCTVNYYAQCTEAAQKSKSAPSSPLSLLDPTTTASLCDQKYTF